MIFLSSNHYSHDLQVIDVMNWLGTVQRDKYEALVSKHPEWNNYIMDGSWFDYEKMGVDVEWSMWLTASIEQDTNVYWWEGEPVMSEDGDVLDDEGGPVDDEWEQTDYTDMVGVKADRDVKISKGE